MSLYWSLNDVPVFQLEKVLQQGDISDVCEPYLTKDDKVRFIFPNGIVSGVLLKGLVCIRMCLIAWFCSVLLCQFMVCYCVNLCCVIVSVYDVLLYRSVMPLCWSVLTERGQGSSECGQLLRETGQVSDAVCVDSYLPEEHRGGRQCPGHGQRALGQSR